MGEWKTALVQVMLEEATALGLPNGKVLILSGADRLDHGLQELPPVETETALPLIPFPIPGVVRLDQALQRFLFGKQQRLLLLLAMAHFLQMARQHFILNSNDGFVKTLNPISCHFDHAQKSA